MFQLTRNNTSEMLKMDGVEEITTCLANAARKYGLEVAPFKAEWYNETLFNKVG